MKKLWKSKNFWLFISALIITGLLYLFFIFSEKNYSSDNIPSDIKDDDFPPATAVVYPENKSWHNSDFNAEIRDSDLGAGLLDFSVGKKGCYFIIEDLGTGAVSGGFRKCGFAEITVGVGKEKVCSSSYDKGNQAQGKCKLSTKAFDRAGNESGWKSKIFNIDLIKPNIGKIILPKDLKLNKNYLLEAKISDNSKITGCWFFVDNENIKEKVKIQPTPCQDEADCYISVNYIFDSEKEHLLNFGCVDIAGNIAYGEPVLAKASVNHPPEISFCKVSPTKGKKGTVFYFEVGVKDSDNDSLNFSWDFGDGETSEEENPAHYYLSSGTYEPKIAVSDGKGGEDKCSTAWVVVAE